MARLWHLPDAIRTALNSGHSPTMSRHLFGRYSARSDADTRFGALNTELVVDAARFVRRPPARSVAKSGKLSGITGDGIATLTAHSVGAAQRRYL
jgi:hypothetical protein